MEEKYWLFIDWLSILNVNFIEDVAVKSNYSCIRLDAYSKNEKANKLYESFGYKKAGQVYFPRRDFPFHCYEKGI